MSTCYLDMSIKSGKLVTNGDGKPICLRDNQRTALLTALAALLKK